MSSVAVGAVLVTSSGGCRTLEVAGLGRGPVAARRLRGQALAAVGVAVVAAVRVMTHGSVHLGRVGGRRRDGDADVEGGVDDVLRQVPRRDRPLLRPRVEGHRDLRGPGPVRGPRTSSRPLRELNILLNDTPQRRAQRRGNRPGRRLRWVPEKLPRRRARLVDREAAGEVVDARLLGLGVPLRFVYAVKDSMFEKLGDGHRRSVAGWPGTLRRAETLRANRTKFFDIVIPMVPFISHRNARELLSDLLEEPASPTSTARWWTRLAALDGHAAPAQHVQRVPGVR